MRSFPVSLFLLASAALPVLCRADSLVTTDGQILSGTVAKSGSGYTVATDEGTITVSADRVSRILYDHPQKDPKATVGSSPPPPQTSGSTAKRPLDLRMLQKLIDQGQAAMTSGEYTDARDAFKDAQQLDKQNPLAARGLGFAYIALNKPTKALAPLELAAQKPPVDRSMVLAISSALVANHNAMRAVRFLFPYMQAHATSVDEPLLNALGITLMQADNLARKSQLFKDAAKLYLKQNTELEASHDGKRRWGVEWLDKADVEAKEKVRATAQKNLEDALSKLQLAQAKQAAASNALNNAAIALGKRDDNAIRNAQDSLNKATEEVTKAQAVYDDASKALAETPTQTFPAAIAVDNADLIVIPGATASAETPTAPPAIADNLKPGGKNPGHLDGNEPSVAATPKPDAPDVATPVPAEPSAATQKPKPASVSHLTRYAVAFAIAPDVFVTAASTVDGASSINLTLSDGKTINATVLRSDPASGLALLKADNTSLPFIAIAKSGASGTLTCMGYPDVDFFNPIPRSMDVTAPAQADEWAVRFTVSPRLPGGPLLQNNKVVGVELGDRDSEPTAIPAVSLSKLLSTIAENAGTAQPTTDLKKAIVQVTAER